jgi:hypothetical protein
MDAGQLGLKAYRPNHNWEEVGHGRLRRSEINLSDDALGGCFLQSENYRLSA